MHSSELFLTLSEFRHLKCIIGRTIQKGGIFMKHLLTGITLLALLCTMAGCTKYRPQAPPKETVPSGATMEVTMSHSFRWEDFLPQEELGMCYFHPFGENTFVYSPKSDGTHIFGIWSQESGEFVRRDYKEQGDFTQLSGIYDMGDTVQVLLRQVINQPLSMTYLRYTFDAQMNELSVEDVTAQYPSEWWIEKTAMDAKGNRFHAVVGEGIFCEKPDGTLSPVEDTEGNEDVYRGRDGSVYAILDRRTLKKLHADTLKAENIPVELPKYELNRGELMRGNTQYDVLCYTDEFLYGMNLTDGSMTEILNWQESDVVGDMDKRQLYLLPDGRALFTIYKPLSNYLLTPRTQAEVESMTLISMADMSSIGSSSWFDKMVSKFNRQSKNSRIVTKSYFDSDAPDFGEEALKKDLLDGIIPDILASTPDYHTFSEKGLFEDLSVWMENDPDFHEDDYFMNFFEALEYKGRLECMGFGFGVNTYMAKTEFLDGSQRLTLSDYANLTLPEGMELLSAANRESAFHDLMYCQLAEFVDYETASCSFDSEEFVSLLAFFSDFPEKAAVRDDYAYRENRALLYPTQIYSLQNFHGTAQCWFDNADVTLTGTPIGEKGNGGVFAAHGGLITVSSASQHKEEIWKFIKFCLREENQLMNEFSIPVNRNALAKAMEQNQQPVGELDTTWYTIGDEQIEITPATAEEAEKLLSYLEGIALSTGLDDTAIQNIVEEETAKCFAGDCTAEDAAKIIQSRVSLYLAEQY